MTELGIDVIEDLPVGQNLQDHIFAGGVNFLLRDPVSVVQSRIFTMDLLQAYQGNATGPLTLLGGVEGLGFIKTKYADPKKDWPDIEIHFASGSPVSDGGQTWRVANGLKQSVWDAVYEAHNYEDTMSLYPVLLRPKSIGKS